MIDLTAAPPEIRERLAEWLALAETEGATAVAEKLAAQSARQEATFVAAAVAVERLLRD